MNRPHQNWLLISFDQWRGDWLLQPWLHLPHLKRLARSGWLARCCLTSSPQCVPSRASWLTGLWPSQLGLERNRTFTMPANAPSFVRDLQGQGYHTVLLGKSHWTPHHGGLDLRDNLPLLRALGFERAREIAGPRALAEVRCELSDLWDQAGLLEAYRADLRDRYAQGVAHRVRPTLLPEVLYPDLWIGAEALLELERLPEERPWFCWISFPGPHEPFDVPRSWRGRFPHGPIPPAEPRPGWAESLPAHSELRRRLEREPIPPGPLDELRQDYADHLALLDAQVGGILAALQRRSDGRRTAISVVSDHGELLGDWGLLLKGCFLEAAVRSLFLHCPPGGRRPWEARGSDLPFPLTEGLQTVASMVPADRRLSPLEHLRRHTATVRSEFGGERLLARGRARLVVDRCGRLHSLSGQAILRE